MGAIGLYALDWKERAKGDRPLRTMPKIRLKEGAYHRPCLPHLCLFRGCFNLLERAIDSKKGR